jgi:hypothetical protein
MAMRLLGYSINILKHYFPGLVWQDKIQEYQKKHSFYIVYLFTYKTCQASKKDSISMTEDDG